MVSSKRQIPERECMALIRSGMTDEGLMEKYRLSRRGLQKLYLALIESKQISEEELYAQSALFRRRVDHLHARCSRRVDLGLPLWIFELNSARRGLVRDISETGMRIAGITSFVGEEKTFQLPVDMFLGSDPLLLCARCIWVETKGKSVEYSEAGYRIVHVSQNDKDALKRLVGMLVLSGSGEWSAVK
jgi:hypothetical protein